MTGGLEWAYAVSELRDRRTLERRANAEECDAISRLLGEPICKAFGARYEIIPLGPGRYQVKGRLRATIEQICGVTLDPVEQAIDETFDVEFRTDARQVAEPGAEFDAFSKDDPEPIEQGRIRIGRYLSEVLASAIDPFPRAPGAELECSQAGETDPASNPFAALERLKGRR